LPGDESAILFSFQPPISSAPVQSDQIEPDVESEHFPVHSSNAESTVFLLYPSSACFPVSSHFELLADEKDTYTFSPMSSAPLLVRKTGESLKILVLAQSVESGNSCGPSGLPPKPPASGMSS
jgi:hypothetical protein